MNDCLFCKIISGDIPSTKVYEDENVYAFLDIAPIHHGHTLVVPKKHSRNALEMSVEEFSALAGGIHKVAGAVKKAVESDGINIVFNVEKAAGQVVFHTHAHIVPRFENDNLPAWPGGEYEGAEAEVIAEKISKEL